MTRRFPRHPDEKIRASLRATAIPGRPADLDAAAEHLTGGMADDLALRDAKRQIAKFQREAL